MIGGGRVGYQVQVNQWIFGVEGSVDGTSLTKDVMAAFPNFLGGSTLTAESYTHIQGSIRGKLGFAWDRLMIYGTGGVAFGSFDADFELAVISRRFVTPFSASDDFSSHPRWLDGGRWGSICRHPELVGIRRIPLFRFRHSKERRIPQPANRCLL